MIVPKKTIINLDQKKKQLKVLNLLMGVLKVYFDIQLYVFMQDVIMYILFSAAVNANYSISVGEKFIEKAGAELCHAQTSLS